MMPFKEREGPIAQPWEGEGASRSVHTPSPFRHLRGSLPLPHGERG